MNFVIFWPQILWKCIDSGFHISATPYTTSCLSLFNFAHLFVHDLKMCMWFGFNPAVNFCHFFHFVNFVIFRRCDINFTEVRYILLSRQRTTKVLIRLRGFLMTRLIYSKLEFARSVLIIVFPVVITGMGSLRGLVLSSSPFLIYNPSTSFWLFV